jgi:hypothetical protein
MLRYFSLLRIALTVVIVALCVTASGSSSLGDQSAGAPDTSIEARLEKSFLVGLKRANSERRDYSGTTMDCDWFFYDFYRVTDDAEAYKKFFASKDFDVGETNENNRHYIYTSLSYKHLWLSGYFGFHLGDELRVMLTTTSAESSKITSFRVRVVNPNHPSPFL